MVNVWGVGYRLLDGAPDGERGGVGGRRGSARRRRRIAGGGCLARLGDRMEAVARACHELRGPLTAARLGLELAAAGSGALARAAARRSTPSWAGPALALDDLAGTGRGARGGRPDRRVDVSPARGRLGGGVAGRCRGRGREVGCGWSGAAGARAGATGCGWPRRSAT